jgi:hypothetical protein
MQVTLHGFALRHNAKLAMVVYLVAAIETELTVLVLDRI